MKPYYTVLIILSALPTLCQAAPPTITAIAPRGVERGKPVEITISGTNLTPDSQLWTAFDAEIKRLPEMKPNPAQAKFLVTASAKNPIGFFLVRVFTAEGVSAPAAFAVDPFPATPEKEDNNTLEKAQSVPLPTVIDGQCGGGDLDFYRFAAKKGQRLVLETEAARLGTAIVPHLRLTDAKGRYLASDDRQRLRGDARIVFSVPADGEYVVEMSDSRYRGGNPPHYRLKIGEYDVIEEVFPLGFEHDRATRFTWHGSEPGKEWNWERLLKIPGLAFFSPRGVRLEPPDGWNEGMAWPEVEAGLARHHLLEPRDLAASKEATSVAWPATVAGRLEKPGRGHRFTIEVKEEQKLRLTMQAQSLGSYLDGRLRVLDEKDKLIAQADDVDIPPAAPGQPATKSTDPILEFAVPKGMTRAVIDVRDGLGRGGVNFGYLLTIEPATPDFQLRLLSSEVNVPKTGFALLPIAVVRRGYEGPILLEAKSLPPGLSALSGFIPAKTSAGAILLRNGGETSKSPKLSFASVQGKALEGPAISDVAEFRLVLGKEANPAVSSVLLDKIALGSDAPPPLRLEGPPSIDLVMGIPKNLAVTLNWEKEAKDPRPAVEVGIFGLGDGGKPLPGGVTIKSDSIPSGGKSGNLVLVAPVTLAQGRTHDLILQAKTKVAGKDVTVVGPAVNVQVHRPFELTMDEKHTLQPGQTVRLKGSIKRQSGFRDPVQLKLDGLPPGVALTPIKPLAPDQGEFQIELKVDAKAAPVMASPTLTATATIGGMAYTHPARKLSLEVQKK